MQLVDWFEYNRMLRKIRRADEQNEKLKPQEPADDWELYVRESDKIYEWRQLVMTRYLKRRAEALHLPLPDRSDKSLWQRVDFDDDPSEPKYLSQKGVMEAKKLIREEQKARRDAIAFWVPIFFGTGGMVMGIITALKHS